MFQRIFSKTSVMLVCAFLSISAGSVWALEQSVLGKVTDYTVDERAVTLHCENGKVVKLSVVAAGLIRLQVAPKGTFDESLMIRWGYVKDDWPVADFEVQELDDRLVVTTSALEIAITKSRFSLSLLDRTGRLLLQNSPGKSVSCGATNSLNFRMQADEHFFGFGFMRSTLDARGKHITWKRDYRWKEATVPFFMSTRGYGFYSNNTWNHQFDFTDTANGNYQITSVGGQVDCYLVYGPTFRQILKYYVDLTGHSDLVPKWAFGAQYRARYFENQENLLRIAKTYREREIPCETMALEPGWEKASYSMAWEWSPERFPAPEEMIRELHQLGFQFDLWESGIAPFHNPSKPDVRQAWYDQRRAVIDQGVRMFKQDDPYPRGIKSTELLAAQLSDKGITDDTYEPGELTNISNTLYTDTLFTNFRKQTGQRAIVMFHAYNASVASHRWPFQWAGDFQAGNGMLNASLSGHAMVSYDIRNPYPAGWHQGFLTPFSVVDSWAYYREPWLYSHTMEESHRRYACLRSRLTPYLYSSLWQSRHKGVPIMRPMVLDYTSDDNTYNMGSQYLLGDWLLVGVGERNDAPKNEKVDFWSGTDKGRSGKVYLPAGAWIDYWTGEQLQQDQAGWISRSWPEYMGGILLVKAGAIIPMGQVKNYSSESADEIVVFDIYPAGASSYKLYEDDGLTYDYETGAVATTNIACKQNANQIQIDISARQGTYAGMPQRRCHLLKVHAATPPRSVQLDGVKLPQADSSADLAYDPSVFGWSYDTAAKKIIIKPNAGWAYANRTPGKNPLATIPPTAQYERIVWQADVEIQDESHQITLEMPTRPLLHLTTSLASLPADGSSRTELEAVVVGNSDFDGECSATLEGPAKFADGHSNMSLRFTDGASRFSIVASNQPGIARVHVRGDNTEGATLKIPIHGEATSLVLQSPRTVLLANSEHSTEIRASLFDSAGRQLSLTDSPVQFHSEPAGALNPSVGTVDKQDGQVRLQVAASQTPAKVKIWATHQSLSSQPLTIESVQGQLEVKMNPPEVIELPSKGSWLPNQVSVFVNICTKGKLVKAAEPTVTLALQDVDRNTLQTYRRKAVNGELDFKNIAYKSRDENYYLVISSPGYEPVTLRLFENTWKK